MRSVSIKTYLVLTSILIASGFGCRKDICDKEPTLSQGIKLMNTGYFWDPAELIYHPCFWLDEKITQLPVPEGKSAFAYGFAETESDLFIAGTFDGTGDVVSLPCYWKNGIKNNLPTDRFGIFQRCAARDVIIWNGRTFILGAVDLKPVMWILMPDGAVRQIIIDGQEGTRSASNFIVHDKHLILGGDKMMSSGTGYFFEIGFWRVTADGVSQWESIEKNLRFATAFAVNASSGKVLITGERNVRTNNSLDSYMSLWSQNGTVTIE
ncbi:MAG: hypothetical protein EOO00_03345, partial [Chitinophagaceae bacterium]